jgi:hypothetical protein
MKKILLTSIIILLVTGCATINYQVSARKDPFIEKLKGPKTYALKTNKNANDAIIDKKILYLIGKELEKNGWQKNKLKNAKYIFSIEYEMQGEKVTQTGSRPIRTRTRDYKTGKSTTHVTQQAYSRNYNLYDRKIKIIVTSRPNGDEIWSADCVSEGVTQDILFAAKYMIPFAISKFPNEGLWNKREGYIDN